MDTIIKYWSQILILLSVTGFLIKRAYDYLDKKKFKRFEIFHDKKIEAVIQFADSFYEFKKKVISIFLKIIDNNLKKEDVMILDLKDDLKLSFYKLNYYLNKKEWHQFYEICEMCDDLLEDLHKAYLSKTTSVKNELYFKTIFDNYFHDAIGEIHMKLDMATRKILLIHR